MKKLRVIQAILVLFSALAITSCGEDITLDPAGGGQFTGSDLRVSFDNGVYVADEVTANVAGGAITFTSTRGTTGEMLAMTLNQTALTLSNPPQSIHAYNNVSMTYMESATGDEYVNVSPSGETSGTIVVTEVDLVNRTISGYFAFIGYNPDAPAAQPVAFYSGSFNNVVYTGDALPTPIPAVPTGPATQYFKAKIDGTAVDFGMLSAMPASGNLVLSGGTVTPLTSLSITVPQTIAPGSYNFATSPLDGAYGVYNTGSTAHVSQTGTLTIISNSDGVIKGTFSFEALNGEGVTVQITEGEFLLNVS